MPWGQGKGQGVLGTCLPLTIAQEEDEVLGGRLDGLQPPGTSQGLIGLLVPEGGVLLFLCGQRGNLVSRALGLGMSCVVEMRGVPYLG